MLTSLKAWIWMTQRLNASRAISLLRQFGTPEACYFAEPSEYLSLALTEAEQKRLADKKLDEADRILADCDEKNIGILTWQDAEYPERLRNIETPPLLLYYRGTLPRFDEEIAIAMAGTRRATPYGRKLAGELSFQITRLGGLVLTGIVEGCDRYAADGALKAGGPLCCIMAGGVDTPYYDSDTNRQLLADVVACGVLLSEYPPGTPHLPDHFAQRNRILTGLSLGTLCVEAPVMSGTLQVARLALEQGRDVYAVPANVDAVSSAGTNQLLTRGEAICVCSGADVLEHYWSLFPQRRKNPPLLTAEETAQRLSNQPARERIRPVSHNYKKATKSSRSDSSPTSANEETRDENIRKKIRIGEHQNEFTDDELAVLRVLNAEPAVSDTVTSATGLPARRVSATLTVLTIRGLVRQLPGGRFSSTVELIESEDESK